MAKITVKRIVPMYTIITDKFKKELANSSAEEIKLIDNQIESIQGQIKHLQGRFGLLTNQATKVTQDQINHSILEMTERLEQLRNFKNGMLESMNEMKNKPNGTEIQTGMIENYVEINEGDNIRKLFERAKIVIKDDIIQEITE